MLGSIIILCSCASRVLCYQWKRRVDCDWEPSGSDCGLGHPWAVFCRKGVQEIHVFPAIQAAGCRAVSVLMGRWKRSDHHPCHQRTSCVGSSGEAWAASWGAGAEAAVPPLHQQSAGIRAPCPAGRDQNPKGQSITDFQKIKVFQSWENR